MQHLHGDAIAGILQLVAKARRQELNQAVYAAVEGRVAGGPFEGMILPDRSSWLDGDVAPKLLGVYEAELHELVRQVVAADYPVVVNVGCAEGFYAVGLARLMPRTIVHAFDISPEAQRVCREAAATNGVAGRVVVGGRCDAATLERVVAGVDRAFLLLDCEGGEKELLDPVAAPAVGRCDFTAECHDFYDRQITSTVAGRFAATHEMTLIQEGPRDPNAIAMLTSLGSLDRWLTVCEFRPETMHWLVGTRKQAVAPGAA